MRVFRRPFRTVSEAEYFARGFLDCERRGGSPAACHAAGARAVKQFYRRRTRLVLRDRFYKGRSSY